MRLVVELLIDGERTFANWMHVDDALLGSERRCWVDCPTPDGRTARAQLILDDEEAL
jgi:hypothetical protein